ncbi:MAG: prepilin-type N-terminal cleavage/methylation domain-containing protein [Bdellovibrionales bacterium]|nr:prepilin-type N-terminal cleavage/methylation domain-containing protein [Bdellovibrionales bacterium]
MKINNNKGFSLIEVLVTVGLVGLLVGIAIPSYNGYKKNTLAMALRADLGSGAKVYNAKYAVDSHYCHSFSDVGLSTERATNPIYRKSAFYGFQTVDTTNCGAVTAAEVQYKTDSDSAGKCSDATYLTKSACTGATKTWTANSGVEYGGSPTACKLDANEFWMGATTNVSNLTSFLTIDEEGRIKEESGSTTPTDCVDPAA